MPLIDRVDVDVRCAFQGSKRIAVVVAVLVGCPGQQRQRSGPTSASTRRSRGPVMSANTGKQLSAAIEALAISLYETRALAYSLERKGWHALTPSEQGD